ncbi:MAG: hypothetical protein HQ523_11295 [Lentisphaerae bacterium]|nr:hypothetical protein [Lentisphaerota bacterium]
MKSMRRIINGVVCGAILATVTSCSSNVPEAVELSKDQVACSRENNAADSKYPEFSWDHIPKYMHLWKQTAFTEEELKHLAEYPLITFEKAQGIRDEASVQEGTLKAAAAVKAVNPKVKVLYYKNVIIDWFSGMSPELEKIDGGYLRNTEGEYPSLGGQKRKYFDISLPEVQDWWMKDATRMLSDPNIDGIFIDANIKVWVTPYFAKWNKMGEEKTRKIQEGYHQLMTRLNEEHRQDKIIFANILRARFEKGGLEFMDYFDGSYLENFEKNVEGVSRPDYIAKGIACAQKAARDGRIIALTMGMGKAMDDSSGMGFDEVRSRIEDLESISNRLDYVTAIFLIIAEKYSYFHPHDGYGVYLDGKGRQRNRLWMKELPVFEKRLGPPKGPASKNGYIYTREFEYCSVWLDIENEKARLEWR